MLTEFVNSDAGKWLPVSPVQKFLAGVDVDATIGKYLGWLNWFIPIGAIIDLLLLWCAAILVYYGAQAVLRQFKVIS